MFKNKVLMLTISIFLVWTVTEMVSSWFIRLMIEVVQPVNNNITLGGIVWIIGMIEFGVKIIGTYFVVRYFLNRFTQKTKHHEQNAIPEEVLFHHLEDEQMSAKQR